MNKKIKSIVVASMLVLTLGSAVGCTSKTETYNEATYKNITGDEAVKIMDKDTGILLLDVRKEDEYKAGHIVDGVNIPLEEIESRISEFEEYKDKPVLVYCRVGKRSAEASEILVKNGFTNVSNMEDGVEEYEYTMVKYNDITGTQFETMVSENSDAITLDPRDSKDYDNGHVENSINIPLGELENRLDELDKNKEVLIYCNVGRKSAEAASILESNGFENVYNSIDGVKEYEFKLVK